MEYECNQGDHTMFNTPDETTYSRLRTLEDLLDNGNKKIKFEDADGNVYKTPVIEDTDDVYRRPSVIHGDVTETYHLLPRRRKI